MLTAAKLEALTHLLTVSVSPAPARPRLALEALAMACAAHRAAHDVEVTIDGIDTLAMGLLASATHKAVTEAELLAGGELRAAGFNAPNASEVIEKVKALTLY